MNWNRFSEWAEISDCERYTVCMATAAGRFVFTAWRRATTRTLAPTEIGSANDIDTAKAMCEDHARANP